MNNSKTIKLVINMLIFLMAASTGYADRIFLKSGEIIKGDIVSVQEDFVRVETGVGIPLTYFRDQIERLDTRDFEISFRRPLTDEEITDRVVQMIKEWRVQRGHQGDQLKDWVRAYQWYAQSDGKIVIERRYRNPELERQTGRKVSGTVKVYFEPQELWDQK